MQQTLNPPVRLETLDRALDAPNPLRLWHLLSLDAPTVAAAWSLGFAKAAGVQTSGMGSSAFGACDVVRLYK